MYILFEKADGIRTKPKLTADKADPVPSFSVLNATQTPSDFLFVFLSLHSFSSHFLKKKTYWLSPFATKKAS